MVRNFVSRNIKKFPKQDHGKECQRYCCPEWGVCGITALDKLQKLQNHAARIVTNSPYNASALPNLRKLGWQTVNDLIVEEILKMVYKCTNDKALSYPARLFDRLSETSTRELRNTETDLRIPFTTKNM